MENIIQYHRNSRSISEQLTFFGLLSKGDWGVSLQLAIAVALRKYPFLQNLHSWHYIAFRMCSLRPLAKPDHHEVSKYQTAPRESAHHLGIEPQSCRCNTPALLVHTLPRCSIRNENIVKSTLTSTAFQLRQRIFIKTVHCAKTFSVAVKTMKNATGYAQSAAKFTMPTPSLIYSMTKAIIHLVEIMKLYKHRQAEMPRSSFM